MIRRPDPDDRRGLRFFRTDKGRSLNNLAGFHEGINRVLPDGLSADEARSLYILLERVAENACRAAR